MVESLETKMKNCFEDMINCFCVIEFEKNGIDVFYNPESNVHFQLFQAKTEQTLDMLKMMKENPRVFMK